MKNWTKQEVCSTMCPDYGMCGDVTPECLIEFFNENNIDEDGNELIPEEE